MPDLVHATAAAVALDPDGPLVGALLIGASGSGKSALALALIEHCPFRRSALVSDDAVLIDAAGERLIARAPQVLSGRIEVRGYGPAPVRTAPATGLLAAFELARDAPRLPEPAMKAFAGANLPCWPLAAGDPTGAACRLRVILRAILARNSGSA